ncbi:hypothetical protein [Paenibacillus sp. JDR-2]|uniref:hypothetical protein n=1 Tax=Paenibacillus sp. (strain JDR-2) TaxID=324057 RepID=UPI0001665B8A|nr:hypothetical protein [Paenibacillus sp. JDR-2]ACT03209.1 hypothetical protein Pjdr2_4594 [Paenibacillus sp. JDR-2]
MQVSDKSPFRFAGFGALITSVIIGGSLLFDDPERAVNIGISAMFFTIVLYCIVNIINYRRQGVRYRFLGVWIGLAMMASIFGAIVANAI